MTIYALRYSQFADEFTIGNEPSNQAQPQKGDTKMTLLNKHLFVVEDNVMNRLVYRAVLGHSGAYIEFDQYGREIISRLRRYPPFDLIILDLMLPFGKSGFELFGDIRALEGYESVPIIAVSAAEAGYAIPKAQAIGFNGFIAKPICEELFIEQIETILAGQELWVEDSRPTFK